mmetsp:Transcript_15282/g.38912  ORF Transcript_15282/g.38912 Transcript_15282/m.38912 type:complete len:347 (-) Transcript_15282:2780-3820(-)
MQCYTTAGVRTAILGTSPRRTLCWRDGGQLFGSRRADTVLLQLGTTKAARSTSAAATVHGGSGRSGSGRSAAQRLAVLGHARMPPDLGDAEARARIGPEQLREQIDELGREEFLCARTMPCAAVHVQIELDVAFARHRVAGEAIGQLTTGQHVEDHAAGPRVDHRAKHKATLQHLGRDQPHALLLEATVGQRRTATATGGRSSRRRRRVQRSLQVQACGHIPQRGRQLQGEGGRAGRVRETRVHMRHAVVDHAQRAHQQPPRAHAERRARRAACLLGGRRRLHKDLRRIEQQHVLIEELTLHATALLQKAERRGQLRQQVAALGFGQAAVRERGGVLVHALRTQTR